MTLLEEAILMINFVRFRLISVLVFLVLWSPLNALASLPWQDHYLLLGTVSKANGGLKADSKDEQALSSPFLVAITLQQALVGWTEYRDNGGKKETYHRYFYVSEHLAFPLSINFLVEPTENMISVPVRKFNELIQQEPLSNNNIEVARQRIVTGPFENFALAVFFADPSRGFPIELTQGLFADKLKTDKETKPDSPKRKNEAGSIQNKYGEFRVSRNNGIKAIELIQKESDIISVFHSSTTLRDFKSPFFETGIKSIRYECVFKPPVSDFTQTPWEAQCVSEIIGINKKAIRTENEISVTEFITDSSHIDSEIKKIIDLIPEGQPIVSGDKITYQWHSGDIKKSVDVNALDTASEAEFENRSSQWSTFIIVNLAIIIGIIVYFIASKRNKSNG